MQRVTTSLGSPRYAKQQREFRAAFAAVLAVAILVRIVLLVGYGPQFGAGGDDVLYREMAFNLLEKGYLGGQGERPPLYPLLLAGIWAVSGRDNLLAVSIVQGLLGISTSILWFIITWKLLRSIPLALLAGVISSIDLPLVTLELRLLSEPLEAFLFALASLLYINFVRQERKSSLFLWLLGFTVALQGLTRIMFAAFASVPLVLLGTWVIRSRRYSSISLRRCFYFASALLIPSIGLMGLLVALNNAKFGYPTFSTTAGYNLTNKVCSFFEDAPDKYAVIKQVYLSYRSGTYAERGTCAMTIWKAYPEMLARTGLTFPQLSRHLLLLSLSLIKSHPYAYLHSVMMASLLTLFDVRVYIGSRWIWPVFQFGHYLAVLSAFVGLGVIIARFRDIPIERKSVIVVSTSFFLGVLVYTIGISSIFEFGENGRYRMPVEMALYVIPIIAVWAFKQRRA